MGESGPGGAIGSACFITPDIVAAAAAAAAAASAVGRGLLLPMLGMGGEEKMGAPCSAREGQGCAAEGGRRGGGSGQLLDCSALRGGLQKSPPAHLGPLLPPIVVGFPPGQKAWSVEPLASWIKLLPPNSFFGEGAFAHKAGGSGRKRLPCCFWGTRGKGRQAVFGAPLPAALLAASPARVGGQRARFRHAPCNRLEKGRVV